MNILVFLLLVAVASASATWPDQWSDVNPWASHYPGHAIRGVPLYPKHPDLVYDHWPQYVSPRIPYFSGHVTIPYNKINRIYQKDGTVKPWIDEGLLRELYPLAHQSTPVKHHKRSIDDIPYVA